MKIIKKDKTGRIEIIDGLRGLAVIIMVAYHFLYDAVTFLGVPDKYINNTVADVIQIVTASTFVILCGISSHFSKNNIKRGIETLVIAVIISVVTFIIDMPIIFGILHLLSVCMIIYGLSKKIIDRVPAWLLLIICIVLSVLSQIAVESFTPEINYLWILGFPGKNFVSYDYFPLFPWLFVFLTGTAIGYYVKERKLPRLFYTMKVPVLSAIGRYSLIIYVVHQPLLYLLMMILK